MAVSISTTPPYEYRTRIPLAYPAAAATVLAPSGPLHSAGFLALERRIAEALEGGCRHLVLDLHEVSRIEPDALGFLWATLRNVRRQGATLVAAGARPSVRPALEVLDSGGLSICESVSAALAPTEKGQP